MQRLSLSIFTALAALLVGIAIGHYALPLTKTSSSSQKQTALLPERAVIFSNNPPPPAAKSALPPGVDSKETDEILQVKLSSLVFNPPSPNLAVAAVMPRSAS